MANIGATSCGTLRKSQGSTVSEVTRIRSSQYTWTPKRRVARHLPENFAINLKILELGRERRVATSLEELLPWALAGDAILRARGELRETDGHRYDMMRLITTIGPHLQERISPRKFSARDFRVSGLGPKRILPEHFGGIGNQQWTVARLLDEGQRAATEAGIRRPTFQDKFIFGIDAEAQLDHIDSGSLPAHQSASRVRLAMFDVSPSQRPITQSEKDLVYDRLSKAIESKSHLPTAEFNTWFHANFDQIIKRIAKKKRPGGMIEHETVRTAFIELVIESWSYLAHTIEVFAHVLADSFNKPLQGNERDVFECSYCRSPYLADLPLVLVGMIPIAKPAIARLWDDPNDIRVWRQLLRVLESYGTLVRQRREDDRAKKASQKDARRRSTVVEGALPSPTASLSDLDEIAEEVIELANLKCSCGLPRATFRAQVEAPDMRSGKIIFRCSCTACDITKCVDWPINDCQQLIHRLRTGEDVRTCRSRTATHRC